MDIDTRKLAKALRETSEAYAADVMRDPTLNKGRDTKWLTANRFSWHKYAIQVAARLKD